MVSNAELKQAFSDTIAAKSMLAACVEEELEAREDLKSSEAAIINATDPKTLGSNEAQRTAAIRTKTIDERVALEEAEKAKRDASLAFEIACMKKDCLIWQIRNEQASADCESVGLGVI